ncbi:MAG: ABC transporter substrate-binding protein [Clostridiales bacterium]|nr:ABC transporter substrate-binding protein [Clostridiales bacterium]
MSSLADIWKLSGGEVSITVGETLERGIASSDAVLVDKGAGKSIDIEALLAAQPDFVVCSADISAQLEVCRLLNGTGIPCAAMRVETFDDYLETLRIFTEITGKTTLYDEHGIEVGNRIKEIKNRTSGFDGEKVLFIRAGSKQSAVKAKTAREHFACVILDDLGTHNIAENATVLLDGLSIEEIIKENPKHIFITSMGDEEASRAYMESLFALPQYKALDAVKNGNCHYLPKELFQYKPNGRWAEAYEYIWKILYSEE